MVQEVRKKVKGLKGNEKSLEAEVLIMGKAVDLVSNQAPHLGRNSLSSHIPTVRQGYSQIIMDSIRKQCITYTILKLIFTTTARVSLNQRMTLLFFTESNISIQHTTATTAFAQCRLTGSLSPGDQGLAKIADVEHGWCLDIIPVLLGERVHTAGE